MKQFTVDILTPSKIVAKGIPAESLLVPTSRGQINVLPEHTHLVAQLETGALTIFGGPKDQDRTFSITKGVCKVLDDKVVVLSEVCEEAVDINIDRAKLSLENAQKMLKQENLSTDDMEKYQRKIARSQLRIQLATQSGSKRK